MATKKRLTKSSKYVKDKSYVSRLKAETKIRDCLCCGKQFKSEGWQNRMCNVCRKL